jgi:hypothetical protein
MAEEPDPTEKPIAETVERKGPKRIVVTTVIVIVIVVVLVLAIMLSPQYSPLASIHDADGDGVTDVNDEFPNDPDEWEDTDGDGYGDNGDAFPNDPDEWLDTDNDGVGDNSDAFPTDSTQWADRDGDGYGDNPLGINPDAFPDDPTEWKDTDSDGVGDNADFYDSGNGKIKVSITLYQGDGSADFWTSGDPYFIIRVDANNDGTYDVTEQSSVYVDTERVTNPFSLTVDIADGTPAVKFSILVYDDDIDASDVIDYTPSTAGTSYSQVVTSPFTGSWSYDGDDDGLSEIDCELEYSISVTA